MLSLFSDAPTFLLTIEIVVLAGLVIVGLAADAYFLRRRSALAYAAQPSVQPAARSAQRTLAGWHRAAWRRARHDAADTLWNRVIELSAKAQPVYHGPVLMETTQGSKSSDLEFKPGVGTNRFDWQS